MTPEQIKYAIEIGESLVQCAKAGVSGVLSNVTVGPLQSLLSCAHRTLANMEPTPEQSAALEEIAAFGQLQDSIAASETGCVGKADARRPADL